MAKKEKKLAHSTLELIAERQRLVSGAIWSGVTVSIIVLLLYAIYMILVMLTYGYGNGPGDGIQPLPALNSLRSVSLFFPDAMNNEAEGRIFPLTLSGEPLMVARWGILIGVFIVSYLLGLFAYKSAYKSNELRARKYQKRSIKALIKEEVGLDSVLIESTDVTKDQDVFNQVGLQKTRKDFFITLASDIMSYDVTQIRYNIDDKKHYGLLFITELKSPKTTAYVQFRSFGKNPYKLHNGKNIETFALSSVPSNSPFVVASDLSKEEVGSLIEETMVEEIVKLKALTKSGVLVTLNGNTLSVLLNDAKFDYLTPLSARIDERLLENQSAAVSALYESLLAITRSLSNLPSNAPMVEDKIGEKEKVTSEDVAHEALA